MAEAYKFIACFARRYQTWIMAKWSQLLRGFVPSWKFFDVAGTEFRLEARYGTDESSLGPWENCLPPIRRSVANLAFNPQGNYLHACHNHLSHLHADILECESAEDLTSRSTYQIVRRLVEHQLLMTNKMHGPLAYQFRVCVDRPGQRENDAEEILVSAMHGVV